MTDAAAALAGIEPVGVGFALHPDAEYLGLCRGIIESDAEFFEIAPESLWLPTADGTLAPSPWVDVIDDLCTRSGKPVVGHGLGLSPGHAGDDEPRLARWLEAIARDQRRFGFRWYTELGIRPEKLRLFQHAKEKLAHYSKATTDVEYEYPFGWGELEGIACRTDFDLKSHSAASGKDLSYFDPESKARYVPWVVEPAAGVDRTALTFLIDAYEEQALPDGDVRTVLHFHPEIAPITVAVLPLVKKEGMPEKASEIDRMLRQARFTTFYDESAAIGRRYRRQDEVGTPFCVTIDGETLKNDVVTVRHRDSMAQESVKVTELEAYLRAAMRSWKRPAK